MILPFDMSFINAFVLLFAFFAASRAALRFRSKELSFEGLVFWIVIWSMVGASAIFPQVSTVLASFLGVGRGVDVSLFLAVIILFYLLFRIYIRLDRLDKDITNLVIRLSIDQHAQSKKKTGEQ